MIEQEELDQILWSIREKRWFLQQLQTRLTILKQEMRKLQKHIKGTEDKILDLSELPAKITEERR